MHTVFKYVDIRRRCKNFQEDCRFLQKDLNSMSHWSVINKLDFNISKCHVMVFSRNKNKINHSYNILNTKLSLVNSIRDLGVHFDAKLTFSVHINEVVADAYRVLGFIKRCTRDFTNPEAIKLLYNSFVRSRLEYASLIWNPSFNLYENKVEMVQNKFLRYLTYKITNNYPKFDSYDDLMKQLGYKSLAKRRVIAVLLFIYKLFNNRIGSPNLLSLFNLSVPNPSTRPKYVTFYCSRSRTQQHSNSPVLKSIKIFNKYSNEYRLDIFATTYSSIVNQCKQIT